MARKRLSGPQPDYLMLETKTSTGLPGPLSGPLPVSLSAPPRAPIAQIASETAALAAFEEVSAELRAARDEGRMLLRLSLSDIAPDYLIRDRIDRNPEAMEELIESIRLRGQQTPIEVVDRGPDAHSGPGTERYGLISGWRRCVALDALVTETGDGGRYGHVLALVRRPETGSDAYVAMVEENEIRTGLSFYERARIVMRAVEAGIFPSEKAALQGMFANVSYAKRSKIKSFIPVVTAFDGALRFPTRIPERTGLALSHALATKPDFVARAMAALKYADPATPDQEVAALTEAMQDRAVRKATPGIKLSGGPGRVTLQGDGVDAAFLARLDLWLAKDV